MLKQHSRVTNKVIPDANITILIKGLAVSNFNELSNKWETVFLRDIATHQLKIIVNKYLADNLFEQTIFENIDVDERFFISANPAQQPEIVTWNQGDESMEFVIDLNGPDLYQNNTDIFETNSNRPFTFLSISDSVFYAQNVPQESYEIGKGLEVTNKKRVADVTGADIKCEIDGVLNISTIIQPNLIPQISIEANISYEIIFDNSCGDPPSANETDFVHYNSMLKSDLSKSFTEGEGGGGPKTGSCHRCISSDLGGLHSLSDLLRPIP
jgi:hypothetical protein